jgi:superfamily II DNA or RNA helicase
MHNLSTYFADHYNDLSYPIRDEATDRGLRQNQLGALYAIGSHFTLRSDPALIVMPTGSGKTEVLILAPYLLRATRILVITPSRFVRQQIVRKFEHLDLLKRLGVFPALMPTPKVLENDSMITSLADWEAFRDFDVVISTPNTISPAREVVPSPPDDLFDLLLIDEAHHRPAPTWNAILESFLRTRSILFTATPFRRDRREVRGKFVYSYPMQRAFEDGIFGKMQFLPVQVETGESPDKAIARNAEQVFDRDCVAGFRHVLMVRADSRPTADRLEIIYREHTRLRLEKIHSGLSAKTVAKHLERLRSGDLDGVICVDMLGEGFDLPNLKIAALHAPHRSLAVTLQFIGRFARTNAADLGQATILAIQDEFEGEAEQLFRESEAWQQLVLGYAQARIAREQRNRQVLDGLTDESDLIDDDLSDFSPAVLRPKNHVKIYEVFGEVKIDADLSEAGFQLARKPWINRDERVRVFITRERLRPKWADTDRLDKLEHDLYVIYHDEESNLLFICTTAHEETIYSNVIEAFVAGFAQPLSLYKVSRVLRGLTDLELFNVGMRNRLSGTNAESYRNLHGSGVHHAVARSDGQIYHRGHVFGRAVDQDGNTTTIGLSSLAKVWRSDVTQISELLDWCKQLAKKIANPAPVITNSNLDFLSEGKEIHRFPESAVLAADWNADVYQSPPRMLYASADGEALEVSLLDCDLCVLHTVSNRENVVLEITTPDQRKTHLSFVLEPHPKLEYLSNVEPRFTLERQHRDVDLERYLAVRPLRIHYANGSVSQGNQLFEPPSEVALFDATQMLPINWQGELVNIEKEISGHTPPQKSIHGWLQSHVLTEHPDVVFYDHGSGEIADFLTIKRVQQDESDELEVFLYHCKGSGGPDPGDRIDDLYEVCGQAIKSLQWRTQKRLVNKVRDRLRRSNPSIFLVAIVR